MHRPALGQVELSNLLSMADDGPGIESPRVDGRGLVLRQQPSSGRASPATSPAGGRSRNCWRRRTSPSGHERHPGPETLKRVSGRQLEHVVRIWQIPRRRTSLGAGQHQPVMAAPTRFLRCLAAQVREHGHARSIRATLGRAGQPSPIRLASPPGRVVVGESVQRPGSPPRTQPSMRLPWRACAAMPRR